MLKVCVSRLAPEIAIRMGASWIHMCLLLKKIIPEKPTDVLKPERFFFSKDVSEPQELSSLQNQTFCLHKAYHLLVSFGCTL
jgi:hypothetical protein